jgi:hypothetical protein
VWFRTVFANCPRFTRPLSEVTCRKWNAIRLPIVLGFSCLFSSSSSEFWVIRLKEIDQHSSRSVTSSHRLSCCWKSRVRNLGQPTSHGSTCKVRLLHCAPAIPTEVFAVVKNIYSFELHCPSQEWLLVFGAFPHRLPWPDCTSCWHRKTSGPCWVRVIWSWSTRK